MERTGTNHFATFGQANAYYFNLGHSFEDVREKWNKKEIEVGPPQIKEGEKLFKDSEGRYWLIS